MDVQVKHGNFGFLDSMMQAFVANCFEETKACGGSLVVEKAKQKDL